MPITPGPRRPERRWRWIFKTRTTAGEVTPAATSKGIYGASETTIRGGSSDACIGGGGSGRAPRAQV